MEEKEGLFGLRDNFLLWSHGYDSTVLKAWMEYKKLNPKTFFFIMEDTDSKLINVGEIMKNEKFDYVDKMRSKVEKDGFNPCRNARFVLELINRIYPKEADIYIGLIANTEFIDTTQEWVDAINSYLKVEFKDKYKVVAPFISKDKDEVYRIGCSLGVDMDKTFSCNFATNVGEPCGQCTDCKWRAAQKYKFYLTKNKMEDL